MWQFIKRIWMKPTTSKPIRRRRPKSRLQVEGLEQRALAAGLVLSFEPVSASDPSGNTIYVAGANGGVWKTTDAGVGLLRSMNGGRTWQ